MNMIRARLDDDSGLDRNWSGLSFEGNLVRFGFFFQH
jgi:hypothetical protein